MGGITKTSWQAGQSGNPNGRPKSGYSIVETIIEMMHADPRIKKQLSEKILAQALKGSEVSQKLLLQYMDGMPTQETKVTFGNKLTNDTLESIDEMYAKNQQTIPETNQ
jgi:hypothetical protein